MEEYREKKDAISVPKNTGIEGFIKTIRRILALPHVQSLSVNAAGKIEYSRFVRDGEDEAPIVGAEFYNELEPWALIRNQELEELQISPELQAPAAIALMFNRVSIEGLVPVAFATGAHSNFWRWHEMTAGIRLAKNGAAYGLPVLPDRQIPDDALILCAGYTRDATLVNCHRFFKTGIYLSDFDPPDTAVSIFP